MHNDLPSLKALVGILQRIPYLASKNVYRVSQYFLEMKDEEIAHFCKMLQEAHERLIKCQRCWAWHERERPCLFCDDPKRDHKTICVVESWKDLWAIEKAGGYTGIYHILGGLICPLDGVQPDDLAIASLIERAGQCNEIILALSQTPEGETTGSYIARKLLNINVDGMKITGLARGLPVGSSLEYMDRLTVHKALAERRSL